MLATFVATLRHTVEREPGRPRRTPQRYGKRSSATVENAAPSVGATPIETVATVRLMLGGMGLLAFSAVCFCLWVWRFVHGNPPWGRLMLLGLALNYLVGRPLMGAQPWLAPLESVLDWGLLIGLVLRWRKLRRGRSAPDKQMRLGTATLAGSTVGQNDEAARWAAGTVGENIVADTLARLGNDHKVIHNLSRVALDGIWLMARQCEAEVILADSVCAHYACPASFRRHPHVITHRWLTGGECRPQNSLYSAASYSGR